MNRPAVIILVVAFTAILSIGAYTLYSSSADAPQPKLSGFVSNNAFINGLYTDLDLDDPKAVFQHVFTNLEDEVTVYPSENYFYFRFSALGQTVSGSISLPANKIDSGVVSFGYAKKPEERARQKFFRVQGGAHDFTEADSLYVRKISNFRYAVTYREKTVLFKLHDADTLAPKKAKLTPDEVYVGPSFDESGMRFFLIFNKETLHLYWILNEDGFVPDDYMRASYNVVIGDRTEFAFYVDSVNNRKILVGVNGDNVLHNNWYDGPFDQLPDNYVKDGRIEVKKYLAAAYLLDTGKIDRYGRYQDRAGARLPVAPYTVYFSRGDLGFVDSLKKLDMSPSKFYSAITKQVYKVPKDYYAGVVAK